jgi:hypothetical protein
VRTQVGQGGGGQHASLQGEALLRDGALSQCGGADPVGSAPQRGARLVASRECQQLCESGHRAVPQHGLVAGEVAGHVVQRQRAAEAVALLALHREGDES